MRLSRKIFTAGRLEFVCGEAEGSRKARAVECGSMINRQRQGAAQASRDDVEWWEVGSRCFGWEQLQSQP